MNRVFRSDIQTMIPGLRIVSCSVACGTAGAVTGTTATGYGMTVIKTGSKSGRYTCQLVDQAGAAVDAIGFIGGLVNVVGPDDSGFTDGKGIDVRWRDIDIGSGAQDGTVEFQLVDADSGADADPEDNITLLVVLLLQDRTGVTG